MSNLPILSASQLEHFSLCKRKWAWRYLDKIKKEKNQFAQLGSAVHALIEDWLKGAVEIDLSKPEGAIAAAGVKHLPLPGTADIEHEFWAEIEGAHIVGKIDARFEENGRRVVLDNKTTSAPKFIKKPDDLRKDFQACLYAAAEMDAHGVDEVELRWIYYITKGKARSQKVSLVIVRDEVEKTFERITELTTEMVAAHNEGKKALDLEYNANACFAYGGCAYQEECNLSPQERFKSRMAQETIIEKLKRQKAEKAAAEAASAPAPEPAKEEAKAAPVRAEGINPPEKNAKPPAPKATPAPSATPTVDPAMGAGATTLVLRDWFAAQALTALINARDPRPPTDVARASYDYATAMMEVR